MRPFSPGTGMWTRTGRCSARTIPHLGPSVFAVRHSGLISCGPCDDNLRQDFGTCLHRSAQEEAKQWGLELVHSMDSMVHLTPGDEAPASGATKQVVDRGPYRKPIQSSPWCQCQFRPYKAARLTLRRLTRNAHPLSLGIALQGWDFDSDSPISRWKAQRAGRSNSRTRICCPSLRRGGESGSSVA